MSRIAIFAALMLLIVGPSTCRCVSADDDEYIPSALKATNDIEWSQMTIRVVDPDGTPLVGTTVKLWAMRAGSGHGYWSEEAFGSGRQKNTAANGQTVVNYPKFVGDSVTVTQVSLSVMHPEYCGRTVHLDVQNGIPDVMLERGMRIRVAGVEPDSTTPLSDCHLLVENGDTGEPDFVREADGWLQSHPIQERRRWFRVVRASPNEPAQFSTLQAWSPDDPGSQVAHVPVRRGVRILGRVSDNVPRPIVRGHVAVRCGSPIKGDHRNGERIRPIWWYDVAPITEDGTFEFPSLPSGFLAQFYAFANDMISAQPTDEAFETCCKWFAEQDRQRNDHFRYGQIARLTSGTSKVTIEMEAAGEVKVLCLDSNGKPLQGIGLSSSPNQYVVGGGSNIFCSGHSSLESLRGKRQPRRNENSLYFTKTDSEGVGILRNMPEGTQSVHAGHPLWENKDRLRVDCKRDQVSELKIKLQRKK